MLELFMTRSQRQLTDLLKESRSCADARTIEAYLQAQCLAFDEAETALRSLGEMEIPLCVTQTSATYVFGFPFSGNGIKDAVAREIEKALRPYKPQRRNINGLLAYQIDLQKPPRKKQPKLPLEFSVHLAGVEIELHVARVDFDVSALEPTPKRLEEKVSGHTSYDLDVTKGEEIEVELTSESSTKYHLIPVRSDVRRKFPGYKIKFDLNYDDKTMRTHVTAAAKDTPLGALAGTYISKGIKPLYAAHPELKRSRQVTIRCEDPGKVYRVVFN